MVWTPIEYLKGNRIPGAVLSLDRGPRQWGFSFSMSVTKRYFWLKLKTDFFDQDDIKVIRGMENGPEYIIFWQQLLLKAITAQEPGLLRFKENIPYDEKVLSTITHTDIDTVRSALKLFLELNMIQKMDDGSLWIEQIDDMVGTETSDAIRKRSYRAKIAKGDNVPLLSSNSPGHLPPELEIEKELEIDKKSTVKPDKKEETYLKYKDIVIRTIEILNEKTNSHYKNMGKTRDIIVDRLNDGYTFNDLQAAIIAKANDWMGDEKMEKYLRPITLFQKSKIDGYIAEYERKLENGS